MAYDPWVNVTSDLVSRINIKSGAYLLFSFEAGIPNLVCGCINGWESHIPFLGLCDLDH